MRSRSFILVLLVLVSLSQQGCVGAAMGLMRLATGGHEGRGEAAETSYVPTIALTESPRTIEASAQLGPFENNIPPTDPDHARGDLEVTKTAMEGELTDLVQQAVLADFRTNSVYRSVRLHEKHPDLVIQGHIYQFSEFRSKPWYAKIPLIGRLFSDSERIEGGVSLDLRVASLDGLLIGIYSGQFRFPAETSSSPSARKRHRIPGQELNRAFTEAVKQVRNKMLADEELVTRVGRRPSGAHNTPTSALGGTS